MGHAGDAGRAGTGHTAVGTALVLRGLKLIPRVATCALLLRGSLKHRTTSFTEGTATGRALQSDAHMSRVHAEAGKTGFALFF